MTFPSAEFVYALLRASGFLAVMPFGFDAVGVGMRAAGAVGIGALICGGSAGGEELHPLAMLSEVAFGLLVGAPFALAWGCAALWGDLFDAGRGESIGSIYTPSLEGMGGALAALGGAFTRGWILASGAFECGLENLADAARGAPLGSIRSLAALGSGALVLGGASLNVVGRFLVPWCILFIVVELGVGLVARLAPVTISPTEVFLLKTVLAFVLLSLGVDGGLFDSLGVFFEGVVRGAPTIAPPTRGGA